MKTATPNTAEEFNARHPIGVSVIVSRPCGDAIHATTYAPAFETSSEHFGAPKGTPVVYVNEMYGVVPLECVSIATETEEQR